MRTDYLMAATDADNAGQPGTVPIDLWRVQVAHLATADAELMRRLPVVGAAEELYGDAEGVGRPILVVGGKFRSLGSALMRAAEEQIARV